MADDVAEYATAAGLTVVGRIELVDRRRIGSLVGSVPVISPESRPASERAARAAIALAGDRSAFALTLRSHGWALESIVHPRAEVSPSAELGEGVIIGPMSVLGAGARLAPLVQVGRGALVGHHVELGEGAVLHPGVNIGGRATSCVDRQRMFRASRRWEHGDHPHRRPEALSLLEHQESVGVNPVPLHRLGSPVALHRFLKLAEVRDLKDQSDAV
jgi:acetyltransferase-like isoleucine patch superfamily enzyme